MLKAGGRSRVRTEGLLAMVTSLYLSLATGMNVVDKGRLGNAIFTFLQVCEDWRKVGFMTCAGREAAAR